MEQPTRVTRVIIISIPTSIFGVAALRLPSVNSLYPSTDLASETESRAAPAPGTERISLNIALPASSLPGTHGHINIIGPLLFHFST